MKDYNKKPQKAQKDGAEEQIAKKHRENAYSIHKSEDKPLELTNAYQYSQVLQLEHAVTNFMEYFNKIIQLSPNYKVYLENVDRPQETSVEILPAMLRHKLKCAAELASLNELGKLPLLEELNNYESKFSASDRKPILKDLKESDLDKMSASVNNEMVRHWNEVSRKAEEEEEEDGYEPEETKKKWPPKLPEIKNSAIKARVFIHKSMINDKLYLSEHDMIKAHNERLEFLGDSILNTTITMILYNKFPHLSEGQLSKLRMKLISNERLKKWSFLYKFNEKLRTNLDKTCENNDFKHGKQKLYADVFEAYIGGLIEDDPKHNLPKVRKWLSKLASPVIEEEFKKDDDLDVNEVDINAKKTLYSLIGYAALNLHYKPIQKPSSEDSNALVECRIKDGTVLGVGKGRNIKIAGMRAAQQVLQNKPLIEKYANLRAAVPRSDSVVKGPSGSKRSPPSDDGDDDSSASQQAKRANLGPGNDTSSNSRIVAMPDGSLAFN
ncbi:ribonuclease III [Lachancea thermotolerans CBS 6340]|uniref:ribonuclease III n=1 Tax=Lachancea thermotolerans (strain ATCC 56472 / CBS 6340 / NRRL Y-8284) TaxID=559295 RepID=C5E3P1_LACTC|nr:KLTH0H15180p [Lachancea thermotolerans CBS 6340]CAR30652.1 KLTH0H15180p [Lachancea thermotolerans CBS 6340]